MDVASGEPGGTVQEPFPIFLVSGRYMLYDADVVSYIRRVYHMCGCLIGTLPQIPQQNIFLGLPLELMVEEAALLVEKGAAYIVDDVAAHQTGLRSMLGRDRQRYLASREEEMRAASDAHHAESMARRAAALERKGLTHLIRGSGIATPSLGDQNPTPQEPGLNDEYLEEAGQEDESSATTAGITTVTTSTAERSSSANPTTPTLLSQTLSSSSVVTFHETKTVSSPPFHRLSADPQTPAHLVPIPKSNSYPTYRHLHSQGYFLSPGLRFGAKYMAYPGDPLRFHSHFIVNGLDWDEEIPVLDVVGGGRLGTGVKKAWMVGGKDPEHKDGDEGDGVRVFSVEWAGF